MNNFNWNGGDNNEGYIDRTLEYDDIDIDVNDQAVFITVHDTLNSCKFKKKESKKIIVVNCNSDLIISNLNRSLARTNCAPISRLTTGGLDRFNVRDLADRIMLLHSKIQ